MADEPLFFVLPGDPQTRTGGYGYDRRIRQGLERLGRTVPWLSLPGDFPKPAAADVTDAFGKLRALPAGSTVLVDGLAYGVLPAEALAALPLKLVALVHHPLALETGLAEDDRRRLEASERAALALARAVIVTSAPTAEMLVARFDVPRARITIAEPGTDRVAQARGSGGGRIEILSVATVTPRKGFLHLIEGLAALNGLDWRCRIVGSLDRAPAYAREVMQAAAPFGERIVFEGEVGEEEIARFYDAADIFVLASLYEGYGMAFAEALAHGLPVIGFASGAVPSVVPRDAGILVAPGDGAGLGDAMRQVIADPGLRRRLAEGAQRAGERLPTWDDAAVRVDQVLRSVSG